MFCEREFAHIKQFTQSSKIYQKLGIKKILFAEFLRFVIKPIDKKKAFC